MDKTNQSGRESNSQSQALILEINDFSEPKNTEDIVSVNTYTKNTNKVSISENATDNIYNIDNIDNTAEGAIEVIDVVPENNESGKLLKGGGTTINSVGTESMIVDTVSVVPTNSMTDDSNEKQEEIQNGKDEPEGNVKEDIEVKEDVKDDSEIDVKEDGEDTEDTKEGDELKESAEADTEDAEKVKETKEEGVYDSPEDLQIGGGAPTVLLEDLDNKVEYLADDDKELIDKEKIFKMVKQYIENYHSENVRKYRNEFKSIYQKYSNKKYRIDNNESEIIVTKQEKRGGIVTEIKKPKYIFYNKNNKLILMKREISNARTQLQLNYQTLVNKLEVLPEEKKTFEKARKKFIELLERYYIYTLYHKLINNINNENKVHIMVQDLKAFLKENMDKNIILDGNLYNIDKTLIDLINQSNAARLNAYNNLMINLQSGKKDKKHLEEIKEYLKSYQEINKLYNQVKTTAQQQDKYIDYIIEQLP